MCVVVYVIGCVGVFVCGCVVVCVCVCGGGSPWLELFKVGGVGV